jgi:very-short-patch-repair endonuclease
MSDVGKYERFGRCVDHCESPIERMFLTGLLFLGDFTFEPFDVAPKIARDGTGVELGQQVECGSFRIDFTLTRPGSKIQFAIELDGHAYHGVTPEQFERDASRQRTLAQRGWTVIRFAGREIVRDARKCATDAMTMAAKLVDDGAPLTSARILAPIPTKTYAPWLEEERTALDTAHEIGDWDEQISVIQRISDRLREQRKVAF